MQDPEAYVIEGLTAIAILIQELENRSEQVLAGRLEVASKRVLHGLIEIASYKETAPEHRSDPADLLRLILKRRLPEDAGSTPALPSGSPDPPQERRKTLRAPVRLPGRG